MIQSRCIVCSVTGYGNNGSFLLKQLYQTLFIGRPGTGHYFQVHHSIQSLLIREICKCSARNSITLRIFRFPKSDLPSYFRSGTRSITCHYLNIDACRLTFCHSSRYIRADRIGNGNHSQEVQVIFRNQCHTIIRSMIVHYFKSKTQSTHRHILIP